MALKLLKAQLGAVLGVERFLSEIKVTANLQHPNLLPLFDSGEANGLLFYVMPFVEGEALRATSRRTLLIQTSRGLGHSAGSLAESETWSAQARRSAGIAKTAR